LTEVDQQTILNTSYTIGQDSSRQGLRLVPDTAFNEKDFATLKSKTMISSPVLPGTIQLTPTGPILLGYDAQTLGGFPRILLLANEEDLDVAGQLKVGDSIKFKG
jgi:allophanate hydrolase subunit 2